MYEITFAVNGNITADNEFGKICFYSKGLHSCVYPVGYSS